MIEQLIVFAVFGGFGSVLLFVGLTQWRLQRRLMRHARPVMARIVRSEVHSSIAREADETSSHRPELRFRYHLDGRQRESDLLHPTVIVRSYASAQAVVELLKPYPVGASVVAYVDPRHPDKGFLLPQASAGPLVFTVLGVLLPPLAWVVGGLI